MDHRPNRTLTLRDLRIGYGSKQVGGPFSGRLDGGTLHLLVGPNGSGKSTLLRTLLGLLRPLGGGAELVPAGPRAYVPQQGVLDEGFPVTVAETVAMGQRTRTAAVLRRGQVAQLLDTVGLGSLARAPLRTLSGGQRQRVFFARALAADAAFIALDEPTAGVDQQSSESIWQLLADLARDPARVVVVATHDLFSGRRFATSELVLDGGELRLPELFGG